MGRAVFTDYAAIAYGGIYVALILASCFDSDIRLQDWISSECVNGVFGQVRNSRSTNGLYYVVSYL